VLDTTAEKPKLGGDDTSTRLESNKEDEEDDE